MPGLLGALALTFASLRADPGDVESSHDYPGFPRWPGFVISDYDEDNPAQFDFPVAKPLPDDAGHVEAVSVRGHRYVVHYEVGAGSHAPTLFQTQQYYEKLAADGGFSVVKSGAVGDVTETFYKANGAHQIWVYLEPAVTSNVVTVVESSSGVTPPPPPRLIVDTTKLPPPPTPPPPIPRALTPPPEPAPAPTPAPTVVAVTPTPTPAPAPISIIPAHSPPALTNAVVSVPTPAPVAPAPPAPAPAPSTPVAPTVDPNDDSLFTQLSSTGRVIVPFVFQPGKEGLDASAQPLIDRIVAMMNRHADLFLRIEGHTDNDGDPDDNMRLSANRAFAIMDKLVAANIDKKRLDAVGVGGLQPLASNDTAEGREKNRRIELVMWKKYPAFHSAAPNGNNYYPGGGA